MKLRIFFTIAVVVVLMFVVQSCSNEVTSSNIDGESARVQLILVDAPGDYLEVNVEIVDIQYNSSDDDEGWKSFSPESGYPINVDLTELIAGNNLVLSDEIIPSGMLKQIRLVLSDDNYLVIDGAPEPIHLNTPSAQQSGLKLKLDTELESGFSYTFILDWDVDKSIVKAGNSGSYNLKPVINVNAEVNSGTLKGNVIGKLSVGDADAVALENVVVEVFSADNANISLSTTQTDVNGDFMFQGLPSGTYVLKIMHFGYQDYQSEMNQYILIEVGKVSVLTESIELLLADSLKGNVVGKLAVDAINPIAMENVMVKLFVVNDLENEIATTNTDINGAFSFQGVMTDSYVLKINHEGYKEYLSISIDIEYGVLKELSENLELLLLE